MLSGTVKWFNNKKGYGFIKTPENEKDIFVHITAFRNLVWIRSRKVRNCLSTSCPIAPAVRKRII